MAFPHGPNAGDTPAEAAAAHSAWAAVANTASDFEPVTMVVDPDERADGGSLDQRKAEQRQRGADQQGHQDERTGALAVTAGPGDQQPLEERDHEDDGNQQDADPEEEQRPTDVHPAC